MARLCKPANLVHISTCQVVGRAANDQPIIVSRTRVFCDGPDTPFIKLCGFRTARQSVCCVQDVVVVGRVCCLCSRRVPLCTYEIVSRAAEKENAAKYCTHGVTGSIFNHPTMMSTGDIYRDLRAISISARRSFQLRRQSLRAHFQLTLRSQTTVYRTKTMHATGCTWIVS